MIYWIGYGNAGCGETEDAEAKPAHKIRFQQKICHRYEFTVLGDIPGAINYLEHRHYASGFPQICASHRFCAELNGSALIWGISLIVNRIRKSDNHILN
jgi:hypothetical protein